MPARAWAFVDDAWHARAGRNVAGDARARDRRRQRGSRRAREGRRAGDRAGRGRRPAWLFYTSGTTGRPKGVEITHANLAAMTRCFLSDVEAVAPGDAILHRGAAVARLGPVRGAACRARRGQRRPRVGRLRRRPRSSTSRALGPLAALRRADDGQALVGDAALGRAPLARLKTIVYGGGPMYVEDARRRSPRSGRASRRSTGRASRR